MARRRVITRNKSTPSQALLTSDKNALLTRINNLYQSIQTLSITANLVPALGSVNKGKITEYKGVTAYILFKKPDEIRIIGLYPVVRTTAFDMVSNGDDFRVYIPAKSRFIEGRNELSALSPNKLENLRPSVFLDALFVRPPGPNEKTVITDFTDEIPRLIFCTFCITTLRETRTLGEKFGLSALLLKLPARSFDDIQRRDRHRRALQRVEQIQWRTVS